jgi:hypothetical protein
MQIKQALEGSPVIIKAVHTKSLGYFIPGCTGFIEFIEPKGAVWVLFDCDQIGVMETQRPLYIGNLDDCDELFELLEE